MCDIKMRAGNNILSCKFYKDFMRHFLSCDKLFFDIFGTDGRTNKNTEKATYTSGFLILKHKIQHMFLNQNGTVGVGFHPPSNGPRRP